MSGLFSHWTYQAVEIFVAAFPVLFALLSLWSSRQFFNDRRGIVTGWLEPARGDLEETKKAWPSATVIMSARDEERFLASAIETALSLQWPSVELIVIDDGSTDATTHILAFYGCHPRVTVLRHDVSHGKARSINEAIALATSPLLLIVDADCELDPASLEYLATQLVYRDDVAAVTANPRVLVTDRLIEKLQALEFTSTISTQRRGHGAWGRISTMSGICTLFRRDALVAVGGFDATQPTEDIEMTWRLHTAGWRVIYEPHAVVGMQVPATLSEWRRQRKRWASGLVRALRDHWTKIIQPKNAVLWPLATEAVLSIVWCHALMFVTAAMTIGVLTGAPVAAHSILMGPWGLLTLAIASIQTLWGARLDAEDDPGIRSLRSYVPLMPSLYWWMLAVIVVRTTVPELFRRSQDNVEWAVVR